MNENKLKIFGRLDQITRMLEEVAMEYGKLWEHGEYRMRPEDIRRLAKYLSQIKLSHSAMRDTLKLFEELMKYVPDAKHLQKISLIMEGEAKPAERV